MDKFSFSYAVKIIPIMLKYLEVTLSLATVSMIIGLIIAIILSMLLNKKNKVIDKIIGLYISFFRGVPIIAQLFLFYLGLVQIFPSMRVITADQAAIFVFSLSSSAFMCESIRASILSIDKGQMEAALSINMTYNQAMVRVILPQAIRVAIPTLFNSFINLVKDSSLAFTIGVTEMIAAAQMEATATFRYLEAFLDIAIVYWILVSLLTYIQKSLEVKMNKWY